MMYQSAKRYITALLIIINNLLMLVAIRDVLPFTLHAVLILLNGILIVHISCDRLSYQPLVLIKLFIAVNFQAPNQTIKDICHKLDVINDKIDICNPRNASINYDMLVKIRNVYSAMFNNAFIKNQNTVINIPMFITGDDIEDNTSTLIYSVARDDVAPCIDAIEHKLADIEKQILIVKPIYLLTCNKQLYNQQGLMDNVSNLKNI